MFTTFRSDSGLAPGAVTQVGRTPRWGRALACLALGAWALGATTACTDSITGPPSSNAEVDERVLPSVSDARLRLVPAIENAGVRNRVAYDLEQIELALARHDAVKARFHVRVAGNILADYRAGLGSVMQDAADIGAIALALHAASLAVSADFDIRSIG